MVHKEQHQSEPMVDVDRDALGHVGFDLLPLPILPPLRPRRLGIVAVDEDGTPVIGEVE